jgi:hypothetical protein
MVRSTSDPFFEIKYQPATASRPLTIYRSEVIKQNLNPDWKPFTLRVEDVGGIFSVFNVVRSLLPTHIQLSVSP